MILKLAALASALLVAEVEEAQTRSPPVGFGDFRLGDDFTAVIRTAKPSTLNSYSLAICERDMAITGCLLGPSSKETLTYVRDAIPYTYTFSFNKMGKLTDIAITFRREGKITGNQCLDILSRTVDWASTDFGELRRRRLPGKETEDSDRLIKLTTREGRSFWKTTTDKDGNFLSEFLFSNADSWLKRVANGKEELYSPTAYTSILASYIVVNSKPYCDVSLTIADGDTIERRDMNPYDE